MNHGWTLVLVGMLVASAVVCSWGLKSRE
jgi:hypothetical protein